MDGVCADGIYKSPKMFLFNEAKYSMANRIKEEWQDNPDDDFKHILKLLGEPQFFLKKNYLSQLTKNEMTCWSMLFLKWQK